MYQLCDYICRYVFLLMAISGLSGVMQVWFLARVQSDGGAVYIQVQNWDKFEFKWIITAREKVDMMACCGGGEGRGRIIQFTDDIQQHRTKYTS